MKYINSSITVALIFFVSLSTVSFLVITSAPKALANATLICTGQPGQQACGESVVISVSSSSSPTLVATGSVAGAYTDQICPMPGPWGLGSQYTEQAFPINGNYSENTIGSTAGSADVTVTDANGNTVGSGSVPIIITKPAQTTLGGCNSDGSVVNATEAVGTFTYTQDISGFDQTYCPADDMSGGSCIDSPIPEPYEISVTDNGAVNGSDQNQTMCAPDPYNPGNTICDNTDGPYTFFVTPGGTINVSADRSTSWEIIGGASLSGSGTFQTYPNEPASSAGTQYTIIDPSGYPMSVHGFTDNPTFVMRNGDSLLARIVKSADASSCGIPDEWSCYLTTGGSIDFVLSSTQCSITVQSTLDSGSPSAVAGLSYYVDGGPGSGTSATYTNTPQTFQMIADPSGTIFTLDGFSPPSSVAYAGNTSDLQSVTVDGNDVTSSDQWTCNGGDSMTFSANYISRAGINVQ